VLAGTLEAETEANFAAQGRPSWKPLSEATKAARLKRNRGSSVLMILQDRGILAASVSSAYGADFAQVGAGGAAKDYAAIQQFGGTIERLRTRSRPGSAPIAKATCCARATQKPRGVRQGQPQAGAGDLARGPGFSVTIAARPYLPFAGSAEAVLQPEAERSVWRPSRPTSTS
jgi:phage gpG-like protein